MTGQLRFFDLERWLEEYSAEGDPLEAYSREVDFEILRKDLERLVVHSGTEKGGRPGYDVVLKFKILFLQSLYNLSLHETRHQLRDRLSWLRFCGLTVGDSLPDENTLWDFREALIKSGAFDELFARLDEEITRRGYLAMGGQIVDASIIPAPKQHNTEAEKQALKEGRIPEEWLKHPKKLAQKDLDARWTVKQKPGRTVDGRKVPGLVIPYYGFKAHLASDVAHGMIRRKITTDAAAADGPVLRQGLVLARNTCAKIWGDKAYRSEENEAYLEAHGKVSEIHRRKPLGKPMPKHISRGNKRKSKIRSAIEHVFAAIKSGPGFTIRTIGLARADAAITLKCMCYNIKRFVYLEEQRIRKEAALAASSA
ncbi:MAG: IS5 family transposase [Methylobacteriaceae bacterium]|jgi:IS5 family transposase|nr:IS5 family transposase [Methylobacteriaceae bacterium]